MAKVSLTASFVRSAACDAGKPRTVYWDNVIPGFVLEVRATGGKTYYLRYFDEGGRQRQHKLGRFGEISFDQARKQAQRLKSEIVLGGDPAAKRRQKRLVPTYQELADQHLEHAKTYQKSFTATETCIKRHILPRWGKLRLDEIEQRDVAKWLAEKRATGLAPASVEKIRVIFGRSFVLAAGWEIPGGDRNPVRGIARRPLNNARNRYLTADEVKRLSKAVAASRNKQLKFIVGLLLLTGARVSELLHAQWQHVDLDRREWLIPTSKTGKARHVPLSAEAVKLIGQLARIDKCPYLIPNPKTRQPFVTIKHSWQTARKEAKLPDVRIHDLRHSAASFMVNAGIDLYAVGRVLGHADHKSTMRYSHLANDTLLAAVDAGARSMNMAWSQ